MKKIILSFIILFVVSGNFANDKAGKNPSDKSAEKLDLIIIPQFKADTTSVKSVISYLDNLIKSQSMKFEIIVKSPQSNFDKLTNPPKDTAIVDTVFHQSMFKERYLKAAVGYENFFIIRNFKKFKSNFLDSVSDRSKLVLFVNGKAFPGIPLHLFNEKRRTISFFWNRNDTLTKTFCQSYITKLKFRIDKTTIGFGYYDTKNKKWIEVGKSQLDTLYVIKRYAVVTVVLWFLFLAFFFCYLGKKTNLLKEGMSMDNRYSLSLTQFAFWTVIIFTAYFYLWITTFELVKVPDSTLALLGITTLTTAGSKLADIRKSSSSLGNSQSFFTDLLSEGDSGLSVSRCQMLLVTILFGVIYLVNVFSLQTLPDFNNSLLWLIGISSGAFVGMKSVEGKVQEGKGKIEKI